MKSNADQIRMVAWLARPTSSQERISGSDQVTRGQDQRQLERDVRRYPKVPPGNTAAGRLDEVGTARPSAIDHSELVEAAAEADECQRAR